MKNIIILGISGFAIYLLWKAYQEKESPVAAAASVSAADTKCPDGHSLCKDSGKCYDPKVNYLVDPCAA